RGDAPRVEEERAAVVVGAGGLRVVAEAQARAEAELDAVRDADRALEVQAGSEEVAVARVEVAEPEADVAREDEPRERDRAIDPRLRRLRRGAGEEHDGEGERKEGAPHHSAPLGSRRAPGAVLWRRTSSATPTAIIASPQYCANVSPAWRRSPPGPSVVRRKSSTRRNAPYAIVPAIV